MDLYEFALNEQERTLKRLGITHVLRPHQKHPGLPREAPTASAPPPQPPSRPPAAMETETPARETPVPILLRSLFHGKHAPLRTMWTYRGLRADMGMTESPQRLLVFKKIQESACVHLKWPIADISSWPLDVDEADFRKGLEFFRPRSVLLFRETGNDAEDASRTCEALLRESGCRVIVLPSLSEMAAGNQSAKNEAWKILQTIPA